MLIFQEQQVTIESAIARERQIKRWSRRKKEALADGNLELLKQLWSSRDAQGDYN